MSTSHPGKGTGADGDKRAAARAGNDIPKRPQDTNASGEAKNDTGEDNQRQKGERPAEDYIRR